MQYNSSVQSRSGGGQTNKWTEMLKGYLMQQAEKGISGAMNSGSTLPDGTWYDPVTDTMNAPDGRGGMSYTAGTGTAPTASHGSSY